MPTLIEKVSITPLDRLNWRLSDSLPIELGHGLSIQNYHGRVPPISHLDEYLSKHDIETVGNWSVCLQHKYLGQPSVQADAEESSRRLVAATVACLRFLVPSYANGNHCLQLEAPSTGDLSPFNYVRPVISRTALEDCEAFSPEIDVDRLIRFTAWIDWISDFVANGRKYLPLWISLNFSEKSYMEYDKSVRHVLRVMALEALFSDARVYGLPALKTRLLPLVAGSDLYEFYRSDIQRLPSMTANQKLLTDVLVLRNEIAHGRPVPHKWMKRDGRQGADRNLAYADHLTEAVTALVRVVWLHILNNKLQAVFSHKDQMIQYCKDLQ